MDQNFFKVEFLTGIQMNGKGTERKRNDSFFSKGTKQNEERGEIWVFTFSSSHIYIYKINFPQHFFELSNYEDYTKLWRGARGGWRSTDRQVECTLHPHPHLLFTQGQGASKDVFGCKGKFWNVCNFSWFNPTGGTSGTSATTKIVPLFVLLWTNFCNQVI